MICRNMRMSIYVNELMRLLYCCKLKRIVPLDLKSSHPRILYPFRVREGKLFSSNSKAYASEVIEILKKCSLLYNTLVDKFSMIKFKSVLPVAKGLRFEHFSLHSFCRRFTSLCFKLQRNFGSHPDRSVIFSTILQLSILVCSFKTGNTL